jgi:hypothetical protein
MDRERFVVCIGEELGRDRWSRVVEIRDTTKNITVGTYPTLQAAIYNAKVLNTKEKQGVVP